jgi:hypothetical protein
MTVINAQKLKKNKVVKEITDSLPVKKDTLIVSDSIINSNREAPKNILEESSKKATVVIAPKNKKQKIAKKTKGIIISQKTDTFKTDTLKSPLVPIIEHKDSDVLRNDSNVVPETKTIPY